MSNNNKRRNRRRQKGGPSNRPPKRKPSVADAALQECGNQVKRRIPVDYGFALLVFPVGEHDSGRIRYVGDCDRQDILGMMEGWIATQRGRDMVANAEAFSSTLPTEPGYYVLKATDKANTWEGGPPELVKVVDDDGLRIYHWTGYEYEASADWIKELDPTFHVWLGPIPEPWNRTDGKDGREALLACVEVDGHQAALHHADAFTTIFADYVKEFRSKSNTPDEPLPPMILGMLQDAVGHGYAQGIVQQMNNPFRAKAPQE